jgi:hypothetical protein
LLRPLVGHHQLQLAVPVAVCHGEPSTDTCTEATPTSSEAVPPTLTVPLTVEPADGLEIETAGGVVSAGGGGGAVVVVVGAGAVVVVVGAGAVVVVVGAGAVVVVVGAGAVVVVVVGAVVVVVVFWVDPPLWVDVPPPPLPPLAAQAIDGRARASVTVTPPASRSRGEPKPRRVQRRLRISCPLPGARPASSSIRRPSGEGPLRRVHRQTRGNVRSNGRKTTADAEGASKGAPERRASAGSRL